MIEDFKARETIIKSYFSAWLHLKYSEDVQLPEHFSEVISPEVANTHAAFMEAMGDYMASLLRSIIEQSVRHVLAAFVEDCTDQLLTEVELIEKFWSDQGDVLFYLPAEVHAVIKSWWLEKEFSLVNEMVQEFGLVQDQEEP